MSSRWALRFLLFPVAIILIATLFPFEFHRDAAAIRRTDSVFLWLSTRPSSIHDFLDNVLLFLPFGFGLSLWLYRKERRLLSASLAAFAAGATLSFGVEFLQLFLPTRTSSWGDVISNAIGSALGVVVFEYGGDSILRFASAMELKVNQFLTLRRILTGFVVCAAMMLFCSAELQERANLANWSRGDTFLIGNDFGHRHPYWGRVVQVDVTDRSLTAERSRSAVPNARNVLTSSFERIWPPVEDLSPVTDAKSVVNNSARARVSARASGRKATEEPVKAGGVSSASSARIVNSIRKSNQFTFKILCIPGKKTSNDNGTILSIADDRGDNDLYLGEQGRDAILFIRTVLLGKSSYWDLRIPDLFVKNRPREILATYNGSRLSLAVDGRNESVTLAPGAILVRYFKGLANANAPGYAAIYEACFLVPLGFLLAFAARKSLGHSGLCRILLVGGVLVPPFLLEAVLSSVSRSPFQDGDLAVEIGMVMAAFVVMSADWLRLGKC